MTNDITKWNRSEATFPLIPSNPKEEIEEQVVIELTNTPLSKKQAQILARMKASFYVNPQDGETYLSTRYVESLRPDFRRAVGMVIDYLDKEETQEKALEASKDGSHE